MQEQLKKQIKDSKRGAKYRTGIAIKDLAPSAVIKVESEYHEIHNIHCKFYGCRGKNILTNLSRNCCYFECRDAESLSKAMNSTLRSFYPNLYYYQEINKESENSTSDIWTKLITDTLWIREPYWDIHEKITWKFPSFYENIYTFEHLQTLSLSFILMIFFT